jgi:homoaconitase/3-isopropylmalate dehydratase large subunit
VVSCTEHRFNELRSPSLILDTASREVKVVLLPISIRASQALIAYAGYAAIIENLSFQLAAFLFHVRTPSNRLALQAISRARISVE